MVYIFIALLFYTAAILFGTAASRNTNTNLAAAITNLVSAVLPIAVVIPIVSKKMVHDGKFGIFMAICSGIAIAIFALALNKSFALNKVGIVTPLIFGGAIFLSTAASYFIFKEKVSQLQFVGLLFLAVGLGIIIYARVTAK